MAVPKFAAFDVKRMGLLVAGVALLRTAAPGRADPLLGDKREDAAHATGKGVQGSPTGVKLAVTERNVSVRLLKRRVEMPTRVKAGEVTFALVNAGNRLRGFKISGPGLERALAAPLQPGQTATMAVNLQPGVYVVEAAAPGGSAKRLRVEFTAVEQ